MGIGLGFGTVLRLGMRMGPGPFCVYSIMRISLWYRQWFETCDSAGLLDFVHVLDS